MIINMRKKEYQKPEMKVFQMLPATMQAGSLTESASSDRDKRGDLYDEIGFSGEVCLDPE